MSAEDTPQEDEFGTELKEEMQDLDTFLEKEFPEVTMDESDQHGEHIATLTAEVAELRRTVEGLSAALESMAMLQVEMEETKKQVMDIDSRSLVLPGGTTEYLITVSPPDE